jgi:hypothetical protein
MRRILLGLVVLSGCSGAAGDEDRGAQQRCDAAVRQAQQAAQRGDADAAELGARAQVQCRAARQVRGDSR